VNCGLRSPALVSLVVNKLRLQRAGWICGCRLCGVVILRDVKSGALFLVFSGCEAQTKVRITVSGRFLAH
jgi:hypothetical protein